jgi:hypothetical protein
LPSKAAKAVAVIVYPWKALEGNQPLDKKRKVYMLGVVLNLKA